MILSQSWISSSSDYTFRSTRTSRPTCRLAASAAAASGVGKALERGLDGLVPRKAKGLPGQDPRRAGRGDQVLGHRGAGRARAGPGQLYLPLTGRPPSQGQGHPDLAVGHAPLLLWHRHQAQPADLPLPARRPRSNKPRPGRTSPLSKRVAAGEPVLLKPG